MATQVRFAVDALATGDYVCLVSDSQGVEKVQKALPSVLAIYGKAHGIATQPASAGGVAVIQTEGSVPTSIHGLTGGPSKVRVSSAARPEKVSNYAIGDFPGGHLDGNNVLFLHNGQSVAVVGVQAPVVETFGSVVTLDRDTTQTFAGTGTLIIALAGTGHIEGVTKSLLIPAGTASSLILGDDLNASGDAFNSARDMLLVLSYTAGRCVGALRDLGTKDITAPTIVSATVDILQNPNGLVVVFSESVYVPSLTGLSLVFSSGTPRTITAVEAGNGTTSVTFTLSGNLSTGDVLTFDRASTRTLQDLNGNLIGVGSTPVTVADPGNFAAVSGIKLWLRSDVGVITSGASVTDWQDQSGQGNHAATVTSGQRPTLSGTDVVFDGTDDVLQGPLVLSANSELTIYVVVQPTTSIGSSTRGIIDVCDSSENTNTSFQLLVDGGITLARVAGANPTGTYNEDTTLKVLSAIYKLSVRSLKVNGAQAGSNNGTVITTAATTKYRIGELFQNILPADRKYKEIVIIGRAVTSQEETDHVAALRTRWGI